MVEQFPHDHTVNVFMFPNGYDSMQLFSANAM